MDARAKRVERQLTDRYAHAAEAEVAQAKNALAIGHDDDANVAVAGVAQYRLDIVPLRIGNIQSARPAIDMAVVLAGLANLWRIDDRTHLAYMFLEETVEERLVAVLQRCEEDVAFQVA